MTDTHRTGVLSAHVARRIAPLFVRDGGGPVTLTCPVDGETVYAIRESEGGGFDIGVDGRFDARDPALTARSGLEDAKAHLALLIARKIEAASRQLRAAKRRSMILDPARALAPLARILQAWRHGDLAPGTRLSDPLDIVLVAARDGTALLTMDQCGLAAAARDRGKGHRTALRPVTAIAAAHDTDRLPRSGPGCPASIILVEDLAGTPLFTLADAITARDTLRYMNSASALD